jgi:hypothetical protein
MGIARQQQGKRDSKDDFCFFLLTLYKKDEWQNYLNPMWKRIRIPPP